jgi:thiosulfate dehydrogenase [quinone] large subunit
MRAEGPCFSESFLNILKVCDRPVEDLKGEQVMTTDERVGATPLSSSHGSASDLSGESRSRGFRYVAGVLRLSLGWVFLWAFLDKTFALGFDTGGNPATGVVTRFGDAAWIHGGSPTKGFLKFATDGPLTSFYQSFAGAAWADWLFMIALLGVGLGLMLGVAMRITTVSGVALLVMMWSAVLPPSNNPFMDDHIIYALTLVLLLLAGAGSMLGLGKGWNRLGIVRRHGFLQ